MEENNKSDAVLKTTGGKVVYWGCAAGLTAIAVSAIIVAVSMGIAAFRWAIQ